MICEPLNELPQQVDLKEFALEVQPLQTVKDQSLDTRPKASTTLQTPLEYDVLPKSFSGTYEQMKKVLSLRDNEYLSMRWNQFLDRTVDTTYPKIVLYSDVMKVKIQPRKLTMNGQFYGVDNKLSPVPVMEDPRNLDKRIYH